MRWLVWLLVVLFVLLQYKLWLGDGSLAEVWDLYRQVEQQKVENPRLQERNQELERALRDAAGGTPLIGGSPRMRALARTLSSLRHNESHVLIHGESGTGKELIARALHHLSERRDRVLVKVNCGAIPEGLIESELFGHERGAFTGATARKAVVEYGRISVSPGNPSPGCSRNDHGLFQGRDTVGPKAHKALDSKPPSRQRTSARV